MPNVGGLELVLPVVIIAMFAGLPALIAWRKGGSTARVVGTFAVGLVPYLGWVISWVLAVTTKREKKCPRCGEHVRAGVLTCSDCQFEFASPALTTS